MARQMWIRHSRTV